MCPEGQQEMEEKVFPFFGDRIIQAAPVRPYLLLSGRENSLDVILSKSYCMQMVHPGSLLAFFFFT